jgi:hypothetical protein
MASFPVPETGILLTHFLVSGDIAGSRHFYTDVLVDVGAKRLVDGVTDPTLSSGVFYASAANTITGPVVNQADIFPDLANSTFQDHANEAIHRFIT